MFIFPFQGFCNSSMLIKNNFKVLSKIFMELLQSIKTNANILKMFPYGC